MVVCDATGLKRYLSIFQGKFEFLVVGQVVEFRHPQMGRNGTSLSVGWRSDCSIIDDISVNDIFKSFEIHDAIIQGQIDGLQKLSKFNACNNCLGGVHEFDNICKLCKMPNPTWKETFR